MSLPRRLQEFNWDCSRERKGKQAGFSGKGRNRNMTCTGKTKREEDLWDFSEHFIFAMTKKHHLKEDGVEEGSFLRYGTPYIWVITIPELSSGFRTYWAEKLKSCVEIRLFGCVADNGPRAQKQVTLKKRRLYTCLPSLKSTIFSLWT